jgi:AmiR/NasT family two-component response regulator
VRSVLSVHMLEGHPTALNLYSDSLDGFDEVSLSVAAIFAGQAAKMLTEDDPAAALGDLKSSVAAQKQIDRALDILTAERDWDRGQAFAALLEASRSLHRTLKSIAGDVTANGEIPST